jgi:hypothetical protein
VHPVARKPRPVTERFAERVNTAGPISLYRGAPGPCHLWTGSPRNVGNLGQFGESYGQFKIGARNVIPHKFAYEQAYGPVQPTIRPDGTEVRTVIDHRCRRRNCVNPAHLEAVDDRTNVLRGRSLQARNATKTQCSNGHDLTDPENVRVVYPPSHPNGARKCLTCARMYSRNYQTRKRAAAKQNPDTYREAA